MEKKMNKKIGKKGVAVESLVWWLIAIAVLVVALVLAFVLREKLFSIGDYLKNLFRFRS